MSRGRGKGKAHCGKRGQSLGGTDAGVEETNGGEILF